MTYKLRILSLGAGVQSSTLLLMAHRGAIEKFDCAIFADTGWESQGTYEHLAWLESQSTIPIIRVQSGNIMEDALVSQVRGIKTEGQRWASMPFFVRNGSKQGMIRRQCTSEYKLEPIRKEIRRLLGIKPRCRAPKGAVEQIIGISADEARRMRLSRDQMTKLSYPLVTALNMSREDCRNWLKTNYADHDVPRSACVGCPFKRDDEWLKIKCHSCEWEQAVNLDNKIRTAGGMRGQVFLHRSCQPLEVVRLKEFTPTAELPLMQLCQPTRQQEFVDKLSIYEEL